jgi:hypothetical protein
MARNPDLQQKTYYLHKIIDEDIIKYLDKSRNTSELIRNALMREMRIEKGEIALIDIKNRQIIGDIRLNSFSDLPDKKEEDSIATPEQLQDFISTCIISMG